jgi:cellulose synthase/poly-beta-1,6-N-acetylglucosamine synthase-like glycosyltransferase
MSILLFLFQIIQGALLLVLFLNSIYIFVFAVAGLFYKQSPYFAKPTLRKIAVLIPGYKEDEVIIEVANDALKQNYPKEKYDVVIIADSFQTETLAFLKTMPIIVTEVKFEKSTKSKALSKAMERLESDYDIAVILDADNLMETDFLKKINAAFENDFVAFQGHRTAKNMNTSLAILDSVSEEINNHIFRKGHRVLGLSSAIIGSGMAFKYDFFKTMISNVKAIGGFDKEIELKLMSENFKIDYLNDALVYDEKVQKAEVFSNQRRRWLSAQLHYFRKDIGSSLVALLKKGNIEYFNKAIQFILIPRVLLLGAVFLMGIIFIAINLWVIVNPVFTLFWLITIVVCVLAFFFSVPGTFYNSKTLRALLSLPKGMILMMGSLLRIKGANKQFIHTKHSAVKSRSEKKN